MGQSSSTQNNESTLIQFKMSKYQPNTQYSKINYDPINRIVYDENNNIISRNVDNWITQYELGRHIYNPWTCSVFSTENGNIKSEDIADLNNWMKEPTFWEKFDFDDDCNCRFEVMSGSGSFKGRHVSCLVLWVPVLIVFLLVVLGLVYLCFRSKEEQSKDLEYFRNGNLKQLFGLKGTPSYVPPKDNTYPGVLNGSSGSLNMQQMKGLNQNNQNQNNQTNTIRINNPNKYDDNIQLTHNNTQYNAQQTINNQPNQPLPPIRHSSTAIKSPPLPAYNNAQNAPLLQNQAAQPIINDNMSSNNSNIYGSPLKIKNGRRGGTPGGAGKESSFRNNRIEFV